MDLTKIEKLIDFVGRSSITELTVTENGTTVRISRDVSRASSSSMAESGGTREQAAQTPNAGSGASHSGTVVDAPIFGVLHVAPAPGDPPFISVGDQVVEGQTLFIIEAMKVFNKIAAPRAGKITRLTDVNGAEVEVGDMLAEIA